MLRREGVGDLFSGVLHSLLPPGGSARNASQSLTSGPYGRKPTRSLSTASEVLQDPGRPPLTAVPSLDELAPGEPGGSLATGDGADVAQALRETDTYRTAATLAARARAEAEGSAVVALVAGAAQAQPGKYPVRGGPRRGVRP